MLHGSRTYHVEAISMLLMHATGAHPVISSTTSKTSRLKHVSCLKNVSPLKPHLLAVVFDGASYGSMLRASLVLWLLQSMLSMNASCTGAVMTLLSLVDVQAEGPPPPVARAFAHRTIRDGEQHDGDEVLAAELGVWPGSRRAQCKSPH